jgi:hypothetical protein
MPDVFWGDWFKAASSASTGCMHRVSEAYETSDGPATDKTCHNETQYATSWKVVGFTQPLAEKIVSGE